MTVSMIPKEALASVWKVAEPMIAKALDVTPGRYDTIDLYEMMLRADLALWGYWPRGRLELQAVWTTRIYDVPKGRIMTIDWVSGTDLAEWADEAITVMESYARDMGCTRMEGNGSRAWVRLGQKHGFKELSTICEKELV